MPVRPPHYPRSRMGAYGDRRAEVEAAIQKHELRRLLRQVERDERLRNEEREHVGGRIEFYLSDMRSCLRLRPTTPEQS